MQIRYCVKVYTYGSPFPHMREFSKRKDAQQYVDSCAKYPDMHDVELIDRKGAQ